MYCTHQTFDLPKYVDKVEFSCLAATLQNGGGSNLDAFCAGSNCQLCICAKPQQKKVSYKLSN